MIRSYKSFLQLWCHKCIYKNENSLLKFAIWTWGIWIEMYATARPSTRMSFARASRLCFNASFEANMSAKYSAIYKKEWHDITVSTYCWRRADQLSPSCNTVQRPCLSKYSNAVLKKIDVGFTVSSYSRKGLRSARSFSRTRPSPNLA